MRSILFYGTMYENICLNGPKVQKCDFYIIKGFDLTESIRNNVHWSLHVFPCSDIAFYQMMRKKECDLLGPC